MEWLEYVRLNAIFPGPSFCADADVTRSFVFLDRWLVLCALVGRGLVERPLDDAEDTVSSDVLLSSLCGIEGITSAGASSPFLVVVPVDREPSEKRPFAFGAEATRRIKRVAFAPNVRGDSGPEREVAGGVVGVKPICVAFALCGVLDLPCGRNFSTFGFGRVFSSASSMVLMPSPGCCEK